MDDETASDVAVETYDPLPMPSTSSTRIIYTSSPIYANANAVTPMQNPSLPFPFPTQNARTPRFVRCNVHTVHILQDKFHSPTSFIKGSCGSSLRLFFPPSICPLTTQSLQTSLHCRTAFTCPGSGT